MGAILCSSFQPRGGCTPSCGNNPCTYYTFKDGSITKKIDHMVFDLSVFIPKEKYCDLEAEEQLSKQMKQIPFTLGPHDIRVLPYNATLKYQIYTQHSKQKKMVCCRTNDSSCDCTGADKSERAECFYVSP